MAIARVQSKVNSTGAGTATSLTVTLTGNATVGNTLMVCSVESVGVLSQVKYGTNSWVPMTLTGANNVNLGFGFVPVVEASATVVITVTGAAQRIAAIVIEYSGRLIACDFPPLQATSAGSTTNATGTTATTLAANELILGVMARAGTFTTEQTAWLTSPTNSFASVVQTSSSSNNAGDRALAVLERIVTSTGTFSTAGTQASAAWSNVIASFSDDPNRGGIRLAGHGGLAS